MKLYYHKTDRGAEYLCSECVDGTNEGSFNSKYIIRIDGDIEKDAELLIKEDEPKESEEPKTKRYEVNINYGEIVEAKSPEEAERMFWDVFDNSFLKVKIKELVEAKCEHDWVEHGCATPIKKYYICSKCGEEWTQLN